MEGCCVGEEPSAILLTTGVHGHEVIHHLAYSFECSHVVYERVIMTLHLGTLKVGNTLFDIMCLIFCVYFLALYVVLFFDDHLCQ